MQSEYRSAAKKYPLVDDNIFDEMPLIQMIEIIKISMKILKKVQQFKAYSKTLFSKNTKISTTPKDLIDYILLHPNCIKTQSFFEELAETTHSTNHATEIANLLTSKLEQFAYSQAAIKSSFALLQCLIYLLKHGSHDFRVAFGEARDILSKLQAIDTHHFQNKFVKKSKELSYTLETIKQKAKYVKNLIQQPQTLAEQRQKAAQLKKDRIVSKLQPMELSAEQQTTINLNKDLPMQAIHAVSSRRHKRQGSTKLVQIEEAAHANVEKMEGQIAVPRYS